MARPWRIRYAGAKYHETVRGNGRREVFHEEADHQRFLLQLSDALEKDGGLLYAYALLASHFHLFIETPHGNVQRFMQRLNTAYSMYHRYKHGGWPVLTKGADGSKGERLRNAVAIGSEQFLRQVKELAKGGGREVAGKRELRRRVTFEEVVDAVETLREESWDRIVGRRGDWGRPLAMWAARRYCGLTLREIGEHLDGLDYAAVSIALKRFGQNALRDRALRAHMHALAAMLNVETCSRRRKRSGWTRSRISPWWASWR